MKLFNKFKIYYTRAYQLGHYPSLTSVLLSKHNIYIYSGFLGDGNFGDELVYEATKKIAEPHILIPLRRHMPLLLKFYCFIFWRDISGVIIGGGTLIHKPFSLKEYFKKLIIKKNKVYFHGTGAGEWGRDYDIWKNIFKVQLYGGVRGPYSVLNISNYDCKLSSLGDAAFLLYNGIIPSNIKSSTILVNYGTHNNYKKIDFCRNEIDKFIVYALALGYQVSFLPFHNIDYNLGKALVKRIPKVKLLNIPKSYDVAKDIYSNSIFAVGERLHFSIMALLSNTPFLTAMYDKKHLDFLMSVDLEAVGIEIENISAEKIFHTFSNRDKLFNWTEINNKIEMYKNTQINQFICFQS